MSFTPRTIVDSSYNQIGQVIRINITDEGIFRVFYNDISGNMYCSLSRQSNYKQVIIDSARNRDIFDVSNTSLNNFNKAYYGGTYHIEEISGNYNSYPSSALSSYKSTGFYTFHYDLNIGSLGSTDKGPWVMFSEPRLQSYITQGDSSGNSTIYDTRGYSNILDTKNRTMDNTSWNWANQFCYFFAISSDSTASNYGMNEVGTGVPDLWDLPYQTLPMGILPLPLNNNYCTPNLTDPSNSNIYLDTAPYGGLGGNLIGNYNRPSNYYFASYSPKYVWIDSNNNATSNTDGDVGMTDEYYKGNFFIWVDTSGNSDTSGNVYLGSKNRTFVVDFSYNIIPKFKNTSIGTEYDISNVFVDIDADVSYNAINHNFNEIYSKPYFVACSDASNSIVWGHAPYDISYGNVGDININQFSTKSTGVGAKYCKIKIYQSTSDWSQSFRTIIYYDMNGGYLAIANGDYSNQFPTNHYYYNDGTKVGSGSGKYPSIDLDPQGRPHIAFFGPNASGNLAIHYIYSPGTGAPNNSGNFHHTEVKDFGVTSINDMSGTYVDLSNNHPISIKIDPSGKAHIVYQDPKPYGWCLSYWTNSDDVIDISGVDSTMNYLGIQSYGKTIDMSRASVEVYWDLSSSICLFSRDFRRYDTNENKLLGLTSPLLKAKPYTEPLGARLNDLGYINKTSTGWNDAAIYRFKEISKLYIILEAKLTDDTLNKTNTLFCIGSTSGSGGLIAGFQTYQATGQDYFTNSSDPSGSIFIGINGSVQSFGSSTSSAATTFIRQDISGSGTSAQNIFSSIWFKEGSSIGITTSTMPAVLKNNLYRYEFYYNKSNYFLQLKITNLDDLNDSRNGVYRRYNLFDYGGFNIQEGHISIGSASHSSSNVWNGEINKVSVYATDISNIPIFDLSRNGEILNDCSSTSFSSFFDNSGNEGLNIEPYINKYQVLNVINDMNIVNGTEDISASNISTDKPVLLNDIYYLQRINDQVVSNTTNPGQYITVVDRFDTINSSGYYDLWAIGYLTTGSGYNDVEPALWSSGNGGQNWNKQDNYSLGQEGRVLLDLKTFIDPSGGKWVFICGENYLLHYSNDYNTSGVAGGQTLGVSWYSVDLSHIIYARTQQTVTGTFYEFSPLTGKQPDFNNLKVVNTHSGQSLFNSAPDSNDFHIWLGTSKYNYANEPNNGTAVNINFPVGTSWRTEIWWQIRDSSNNLLFQTSASSSGYNDGSGLWPGQGSGDAGGGTTSSPYNRTLWLPAGTYTLVKYDTYGDGWHGGYLTFRDTITNTTLGSFTLTYSSFPTYGPAYNTFTVPSTTNFSSYFQYTGNLPGYKDILIRGNQLDFSNNTMDYSYNIVTDILYLDASNNNNLNAFNLESFNSFEFGGDKINNQDGLDIGIVTTDSYIYTTKNGGASWEKKLSVNRIDLAGADGSGNVRGTWGSYIEKNKINNGSGTYQYDNSGMYIQTSTEPWNGIPGLTIAYNNSDYDLSFSPLNTYGQKTITWEPSLTNYSDFWNINVPNNNGRPVLWREGGGNTIKVYIDSANSSYSKYTYKQKFWTFDSLVSGSVDVNTLGLNYSKKASLYLKDSELDDTWQRVDFSVVDPSLNTYNIDFVYHWDSFTDYDINYSIINLPYVNNLALDSNQYSGFYKLGKVPFQPFLTVIQPASNLYGAFLTIKYKVNESLIYEPAQYNTRLDFKKLGIVAHFEKLKNPSNPLSIWESASAPVQDYELIIPLLQAGAKYEFRVRLSNSYGYGWYSNVTNFIEIPSPDPSVENLQIEHSLFENKVSWNPTISTFSGVTDVQTAYAYDIEKQYLDASNNWITDISFTNFYKDLSGVLGESYGDLSGVQFTGPYDPSGGGTDLSEVKLVAIFDTDISFNTYYLYNVTVYDLNKDKQSTSSISQLVTNGYPIIPETNYTVNDASLNVTWTISTDISNNTDVVWDISFTEIQDDGTVVIGTPFQYTDPFKGDPAGAGKERKVTLPLTNNHLLADASYNIQIKATYTNNSVVTDYSASTVSVQSIPYDEPLIYYNYQEPPVLNDVSYNITTNILDISWNQTYTPSSPLRYDLSMSNITTNRTDVSYNFTVYSSSYKDLDGTSYYPGTYKVRARSVYGSSVLLFSKWSNELTLTSIPEHQPINFTTTSYNTDNNITRYDVSYVQLNWEHPGTNKFNITGFTIPKNYYFERYATSKVYLESLEFQQNNILYSDTSFNDTVYPISNNTQYKPTPRIYKYILRASYE